MRAKKLKTQMKLAKSLSISRHGVPCLQSCTAVDISAVIISSAFVDIFLVASAILVVDCSQFRRSRGQRKHCRAQN